MPTPEQELLPSSPPSPPQSPPSPTLTPSTSSQPPPQHQYQLMFSPVPLQYQMVTYPLPPPQQQTHYLNNPRLISNVNQHIYRYPDHKRPWSSTLFGCLSDADNCCMTCLCPCVIFGQISEIVNEGRTPWYEAGLVYSLLSLPTWIVGYGCCCSMAFPYTLINRLKMRRKFKIEGNMLSDCAAHTFCPYCTLCQEFRELGHHGFEVPLGWEGNMDMQTRAAAVYQVTPPTAEPGMTR